MSAVARHFGMAAGEGPLLKNYFSFTSFNLEENRI